MFNLKMDIRVFKMAFSIFACISFYYLVGQSFRTEAMMVSCLAAILGIHPDTSNMVDFAKQRLIGIFAGGLLGSIYYLIVELSDKVAIFQILLIPIFSIIGAYAVGGAKNINAVKGVIATLIMMTLVIEPDQGYKFAFVRLVATAVGVLISILVNIGFHFIRNRINKKNNKNR